MASGVVLASLLARSGASSQSLLIARQCLRQADRSGRRADPASALLAEAWKPDQPKGSGTYTGPASPPI
jgi:hypothetical protein